MLGLLATGVATFAATNIDDIFILIAFFAQLNRNSSFRPRHVVIGQYLGFIVLIGISLIGFFTSLILPQPWIGLLGFAPIVIGMRQLWDLRNAEETAEHGELVAQPAHPLFATHSFIHIPTR